VSFAIALLLGYALRCAHEYLQQVWRGRVVRALGGHPAPRPPKWVADVQAHPGRVALLLLTMFFGVQAIRAGVALDRAAGARTKRDNAAIEKHQHWLDSLPDSEKRRWPLANVCHPASAGGGVCHCYPSGNGVAWLERLENGDVACHQQQ
jgi:hypothetical protein